jgi:phytoene dehydrogenase-like protein
MGAITVIGGGLAGLIAAIECAEQGVPVRLLEARSRLGGRAASTTAPYMANLGPHALYTGGSLWDWLVARGLDPPANLPGSDAIRLRWKGQIVDTIPPEILGAIAGLDADAPNDCSFREWVTARCGEEVARVAAGLAGNLTFDHDPGRLAADFVWQRIRRITLAAPPSARYVVGGWSSLVARLADRARALGVDIETGAKVHSLEQLGASPVIVAIEPSAARRLLGDRSLRAESPTVALLDVALDARAGDPYIVVDIDEAAFVDRFTAVDQSLAPDGEELVQACVGLRPGETLDSGEARLAKILDQAFETWRDRVRWRRRAIVRESTGALQLPGTSWRDRPPVAYRPGVWLAGDWVAVDGHLAEVSCASAMQAAEAATAVASMGHGNVDATLPAIRMARTGAGGDTTCTRR